MTAPSGPNSSSGNSPSNGHATNDHSVAGQNSGPVSAPTVPLKVYRELAAELQATKALLDSVNTQNQYMTRQNQQLRQEVDRLVQSSLTLQQLVQSGQNHAAASDIARQQAEAVAAQLRPTRANPTAPSAPPRTQSPDNKDDKDNTPLFTEESVAPFAPETESSPREISGIWLWLTVFVIIVTAFVAGFVVVKPLLPSNNNG
ncbi:hypothetical protein [Vacuolonema iberomarrocanum]|uniref:hypothetical protein n=1 Tax=Vacuolonema iberomarrocanum TaxID=3454632 RepID=UPI001A015830|nr:hypothetical protein [filamentous cyanobacterium LEGE 07170]